MPVMHKKQGETKTNSDVMTPAIGSVTSSPNSVGKIIHAQPRLLGLKKIASYH